MTQVLGPTASMKRFSRLKYVGQLYRQRDELERWQHAYLLEGNDERSVALESILVALDKVLAEWNDFWKAFGA